VVDKLIMHLSEDGHMNGQSKYKVYGVYKTFSNTYAHLMLLISYKNPFSSSTVPYRQMGLGG
jgi:hypothetical protein